VPSAEQLQADLSEGSLGILNADWPSKTGPYRLLRVQGGSELPIRHVPYLTRDPAPG
jgi:hypothetical protein